LGVAPRLYLDSCAAIYRVEKVAPWHLSVDAALAANTSSEVCVSDLVRLECRTGAIRQNDSVLLADYDRFFASTTVLPIDTVVYDLATDLPRHGLKTPDAIHLATALHHGCAEFWTNDLRLARATSALAFRRF
jgi:uncharacterized protein